MKLKLKHLIVLLCFTSTKLLQPADYKIELAQGPAAIQKVAPFIVQAIIEVFKEYPYLYDSNGQDDLAYIQWLSEVKHGAVAIAYLDNKPVGFFTGLPLINFNDHFSNCAADFSKAGLDPAAYYYLAEIIILKEHRGRHLSKQLLECIESHAQKSGYHKICFAVEDHEQHPLKPQDYKSLDDPLSSLGYVKSALTFRGSWQTFQPDGTSTNQEHTLIAWLKEVGTESDELT